MALVTLKGMSGPLELERALNARKIAIFGASAAPEKLGHAMARDLLQSGFEGEVVLINRRGGEIAGHPIVPDPAAAADADLAVLVTPAGAAPGLIGSCGEQRIPLAVVVAGGFREAGDRRLEDELLIAARESGVRLLGPNTLGPVVPATGLALSLTVDTPIGDISMVSQSGGIPQMVGRRLTQLGTGFDAVVPLGNKLDIGFADALRVLGRRPGTRAAMLYVESSDEGDEFFAALAETAALLPVVALIGGRSEAGARATQSHTGSMLSRRDRLVGMVEDCGVYVAQSIREACAALTAEPTSRPRPKRSIQPLRVLVVSDGGGAAVLASDALSDIGFALPAPSSGLARDCGLEGDATLTNPHDLAGSGDANLSVIASVLQSAAARREFDAFVVAAEFGYFDAFGSVWEQSEIAAIDRLIDLAGQTDIPLVVWSTLASHPSRPAIKRLRDAGIRCVEWPDEAAVTLAAHFYRRRDGEVPFQQPPHPVSSDWDPSVVESTEEAIRAFHQHGVPEAIGPVVSRDDLATYTVGQSVLRLDGLAHKTNVGGIKVGVEPKDLGRAYDELSELARSLNGTETIRLGPFVPHQYELIVTFWRDSSNGSGWAVGAGGTATEQQSDVAVGRPPTDVDDVLRLLRRSRAGQRVLADPGMAETTADVILKIAAAFAASLPDAAELECNPLAVGPAGIYLLDALVTRK